MSKQYVKLAADIVMANATGKGFTAEQLTHMLKTVAETLENLAEETVAVTVEEQPAVEAKLPRDWKAAIGKNTITCLICGYAGKLLTPHLRSKHQLTPKEYRKQFQIPASVALVSKAYRAKRSKIAKDMGIGAKLQAARRAKKTGA
uniref:MucR family transcriptional regulator n=1 Tax=Desulfobacca acetoxidans TaxID=60893 RepID=A0A7V4G6R7_9BACT